MAVSVLSAAKYAGQVSDWSLTHLSMQKILYLAHMQYLWRNKGNSLIHGYFEAWDYGPVHPTLYHEAKIFGADPIENIFHRYPDVEENKKEGKALKSATEILLHHSPGALVNITHWTKGAWYKHYSPGAIGIVIPNEDLIKEAQERWGEKSNNE